MTDCGYANLVRGGGMKTRDGQLRHDGARAERRRPAAGRRPRRNCGGYDFLGAAGAVTLWPVISWTTEKSPPFLDISSLKVYSVGETCLTVTRTLYLSSPILESAVQFQVSPSTVPFASITSPELSNA